MARRRPFAPPTTARRFEALAPRQRRTASRVADALDRLRSGEARSLTEAARWAGTTPGTVERYAPSSIAREGRRWRPTPAGRDRLFRGPMLLLTAGGPIYVTPRTQAQRTAIGRHWAWIRAVDAADEAGRRPPEPPGDVRRLARNGIGGVRPTIDSAQVLDLIAEGALDDLPVVSPQLGEDEDEEADAA